MLDLLVQVAYAQGTSGTPKGGGMNYGFLLVMVATIGIFYFFMIRPQQRKEKERKKMISEIKNGDRVVTVGGIIGVVDSIKDDSTIVLKISNNTKVEFSRSAVQNKVT